MILNLILKTNLKTISDLKIESESDFQSENDCMFHVTRKALRRRNLITKAHLWAENYTTVIQFCQELFSKKFFGAFAARVPKRKGSPRGA